MSDLQQTPNGWLLRLRCGGKKRERFYLQCRRKPEAELRRDRMRAVCLQLVKSGHAAEAPVIMRKLAEQTTEDRFTRMEAKAFEIAREPARQAQIQQAPLAGTWGELASLWLSGELHRLYPNKVDPLAETTAAAHRDRINRLSRVIGNVQLTAFTEDDANRALRSLPSKQKWSTRKQYELLIYRVLKLAFKVCKLIKAMPLEEGWVTKNRERPAMGWLYPSEDAQLMASVEVPFEYRLAYGVLVREGLRLGELLRLDWADLDLTLGTLRLDKNKTKSPRMWRMHPGVVRALRHYWQQLGKPRSGAVFTCWHIPKDAAPIFREHLLSAGVDRPELFEHSAERRRIRVHDLRATFVTVALSLNLAEVWVMDRTGHKRSNQVHEYRRAARFASEMALGALLPLDLALGLKREDGARDEDFGICRDPAPDRIGVGQDMGQDGGNGMNQPRGNASKIRPKPAGRGRTGQKPAEIYAGATGKKQVGPAQKRGAGQAWFAAHAELSAAVNRATEAGQWALADRLSKSLDALERRAGHGA